MYSIEKKKSNICEPIDLDIHFQETLNPQSVSHVVIELVKNLLFQRHQIPQTFDGLKREIERFHLDKSEQESSDLDQDGHVNADHIINIRQANKIKRQKAKMAKLRVKFAKKAEHFVSEFEEMAATIRNVIQKSDVESVTVSFGLSVFAPKEVYHIQLPTGYSKPIQDDPGLENVMTKRGLLQLFRAVMGHEDLFDRISRDFTITNTFLIVKLRSSHPEDYHHLQGLTPRPELNRDLPKRVKVTTFNLTHQPPPTKNPATISGTDSYTPSAMEMCTPFVDRSNINIELKNSSRKRSVSGNGSFNNEMMIENSPSGNFIFKTPCQPRTKTLDMIIENMAKIELNTPSPIISSAESNIDVGTWLCTNRMIKGFRDPQVESN